MIRDDNPLRGQCSSFEVEDTCGVTSNVLQARAAISTVVADLTITRPPRPASSLLTTSSSFSQTTTSGPGPTTSCHNNIIIISNPAPVSHSHPVSLSTVKVETYHKTPLLSNHFRFKPRLPEPASRTWKQLWSSQLFRVILRYTPRWTSELLILSIKNIFIFGQYW